MNKFFIFIMTISVSFIACNKDAVIEQDVDNNELGLASIDTFKLKSKTIFDLPISGDDISTVVLGQTNDPRFGEHKASLYTEFSLSKNSFSLGTNPVLDSIVLILKQKDSYGKLNSSFDINIYELNGFIEDISYDNNSVLNVKPSTLATINSYKFSQEAKSIRIPLKNSFGTSLLNQFGTSTMKSSDNFKDFFNGIYASISSTGGDGFVYLDLRKDESKIQLYYHNDEITDTSYSFIIEAKDKTINQYLHNGLSSEVINAINAEDNTLAYVSSMSSYKTEIEMPDLSSLKNIIVNKATITVYQEDFGSTESIKFPEANQMIMFQNLQDTGIAFLTGYGLKSVGPLAKANKTIINGNNIVEYEFEVSKYIQKIITGDAKSNTIYLKNLSNNEGNRTKFGGGNHLDIPMKLNIVYTKINQ